MASCLHTDDGGDTLAAAARRPQGQRAAGRRDDQEGRRPSLRPKRRRSCSPRPSATRSRAPTSRSSTCGLPMRRTATSSAPTTSSSARRDGGNTWEPWFDRTDNPKFFNLYAIRPVDGDLYIAGEGGLVLKLDRSAERFKALAMPVQGQLLRSGTPQGTRCSRSGCAATSIAATTAARAGSKSRPAFRRRWSARRQRSAARPLLADAGGRVVASGDGGRTFTQRGAQAADAAHRLRRSRRRSPRARRAARRRGHGIRGALSGCAA